MKRILTAIGLFAGVLAAHAYDYPYLTVQTTDGTTKSVSVESLVLTFQNGQLVATNGDGSQSFALSSLSKMFFSTTTNAIERPAATASGTVEVYSLSGIALGRYESMTQAKNALKQGIYLMKQNGQTKKVAIK